MNNIKEYVDLDALNNWESKLKEINEECMNYLEEFERKGLELKAIWSGKAASFFDMNFIEKLKEAENTHNDLTSLSTMLSVIAENYKSE